MVLDITARPLVKSDTASKAAAILIFNSLKKKKAPKQTKPQTIRISIFLPMGIDFARGISDRPSIFGPSSLFKPSHVDTGLSFLRGSNWEHHLFYAAVILVAQ
ncbi:hypothetical protein [Corynebacterium durum]|uniref:hypothetical protein n=1 Tax=Corynebacterium durum TaxID=61592 RepID=UPI0028E72183|nr:hypothetical protein [Corynebacterium durum]